MEQLFICDTVERLPDSRFPAFACFSKKFCAAVYSWWGSEGNWSLSPILV